MDWFELDKFIRWPLVSGLNGYMSCRSVQTSWVQVWFTFGEVGSSNWNLSYIVKSELAVILAMFDWSKLIGLT